MFLKKLFFLKFFGCLLFLPFLALSQKIIAGKVIDAQTRTPLPEATYLLMSPQDEQRSGLLTDKEGDFLLQVQPSYRSIIVSHIGYATKRLEINSTDSIYIFIALEPNPVALNEVVVIGYENNRKLLETAGSIGLLSSQALQRFSNSSLVPALNTIPGVRMEERSPGSYRLSIRGSLLRSPFGIRNVKVYWNDIPFTDPGGNTPINLLDFSTIGRVEVIKGPAGSIYGAGIGGVVLLQSPKAPLQENSVQQGSLIGSYGLFGTNTTIQSGTEKSNTILTYAHQQSNGYRDHSQMRRDIINLRSQFFISAKRTLAINAFYSDLFYQTPGGITLEQMQQNPRLSRQATRFQKSSKEQQAAIYQKTFNLGISQQYQWNDRLSNTTSLYGTFTEFKNPFITNFERRADQGLGGRTRTTYEFETGTISNKLTIGGELQRSFAVDRNYGNRGGKPDTLQTDDEITALQYILFGQVESELPANFILTLGGSFNRLTYRFIRLSDVPADSLQRRRFSPVFSPRVALLKKFNEQIAAHASVSYGFSPPTVTEFRPSEGSFNTTLAPEIGVNYELGVRGNIWKNKLLFDITAYSLQLRQTIVRRTAQNGAEYFVNAGNTDQRGVESTISWLAINSPDQAFSLAKIWTSYTWNNYRFRNYRQNDQDFSGNRLTGVAPHIMVAGIDLETKAGLYSNITFNFTDFIPLNDANTVFANNYALLGGRLGYRKTFKKIGVDAFAGIDNALNEKYSLGNDINAFGGRYFNPAAPTNYYAGLNLKYILN